VVVPSLCHSCFGQNCQIFNEALLMPHHYPYPTQFDGENSGGGCRGVSINYDLTYIPKKSFQLKIHFVDNQVFVYED